MNTILALKRIQELLNGSGILVNGPRDWDIQIKNGFSVKLYHRVLQYGSIGLGEAYMDGWWTCKKLDVFFTHVLSARLEKKLNPLLLFIPYLQSVLFNQQNRQGSLKVAEEHYNLSTELYESFLDPYNQYTCGYFKNTNDLNRAQEQKLDLICRKLKLKPEDMVLDIGSGWGGFSKFAAEHYHCNVTGITISTEQAKYAREFTKGLPVEIVEMDYRDLGKDGKKYDKVLICGMIEHVGYKNYRTIMQKVHNVLEEGGIFLLHTIGGLESVTNTDPWIDKYIFPNSMLPSMEQADKATRGLFKQLDFHNFGPYYDKTLMAWNKNFQKNRHIARELYGERFCRMWEYYLLCCAGSFRCGNNQLFQFVFAKTGTDIGPYKIER